MHFETLPIKLGIHHVVTLNRLLSLLYVVKTYQVVTVVIALWEL